MKLNVLLSPIFVDELSFTGKTTVVIDVLRASSTILTALNNGAKEVIPVGTVEFAVKVSGGMFGGQTLLGGERNTKKIEGFALGNSPFEYNHETVNGKTIVFFSTNGSKAIVKAKFSANLMVAGFLNLNTVVNRLLELDSDVEILCSGRGNGFSLEDTICAGKIVTEILKVREDAELTDASKAALQICKAAGKSIPKVLKESEHGKLLIENGFEEDINYCSKLNAINILPVFQNNALKIYQQQVSQA